LSLEEKFRGLIANRCGGREFDKTSGGYSFSAVLAEERELEKGNLSVKPESALLKMSVADPTWKMSEEAMKAALEYYTKCPDATRYTDNAGIRKGNGTDFGDTHEEICAYLRARNPGLSPDFNTSWVKYSPHGIKGLLAEYIPDAFFEIGDWLLFPVPGYPVIASKINNNDVVVSKIQLEEKNSWKFPTNFVPPSETKKFLYLNTPHNPTGTTYGRKEFTEIIKWAKENNVILIVDEAYDWIRFDDSVSILNVDGWEEVAIVLQSVSKGWNATGARFGWVAAHPILIKVIDRAMDFKDSGLFGPTIAASLYCLKHPEIAEETNKRYRVLHQILAAGLEESGFRSAMPKGGLCQFVRAPKSADGYEFKSLTECVQWFRKNLRISLMHYEVGNEWYLRLAVTLKPVPECGLSTEISVIEEAVRRLQKVKFEF
jgi:LL-diaminopimelate aminotransferase